MLSGVETTFPVDQPLTAQKATVGPFVDFTGRWVIVTGASSGIGQAIAIELSRRGAALVLMGRDPRKLSRTAEAMMSRNVDAVSIDLLDTGSILPCVRKLVEAHGRLYGLCHCAGTVETKPLSAIRLDDFRQMMEINVTAGIELAKAFSRRDVVTDEGGSILFISSIYGWVGMPGQIGYSATKGAVLAAARAMAVELARRKIRVNTLSPGLVRTPMSEAALSKLSADHVRELEQTHPLGTGVPEDVARVAAFLLAPQSNWITGTDLIIDGGYTAR